MTGEIVLDGIHEDPSKFHGRLKYWEDVGNRKKPVIKPKNTGLIDKILTKLGAKNNKYPYQLSEKNIERHDTGFESWIILKPTGDIPGYSESDIESSFYSKKLNPEESERVQELEEDKQNLQQKLNKKKKDLRDLRSEEEEQNKGKKRTVSKYECSYCSESNSKSQWNNEEANGEGKCPECGEGILDNAEKVN